MFRSLVALGAGWFVYTQTGRHLAKKIILNSIPYFEKETGIKILEPLRQLTKEVK